MKPVTEPCYRKLKHHLYEHIIWGLLTNNYKIKIAYTQKVELEESIWVMKTNANVLGQMD